jgi:hypothetical protein
MAATTAAGRSHRSRVADLLIAAAAATRRTTLNTDVPPWADLVRVTGVLKRTLQRARPDVAAASREVALIVVTAAAALAAGAVAEVAATRQRRALLLPRVPSGAGRFSCAKSMRRLVPARFRRVHGCSCSRYASDYRLRGAWAMFRHEMDHGLLIEGGIHHLDQLRNLCGADCETIAGWDWNPGQVRGDTAAWRSSDAFDGEA